MDGDFQNFLFNLYSTKKSKLSKILFPFGRVIQKFYQNVK